MNTGMALAPDILNTISGMLPLPIVREIWLPPKRTSRNSMTSRNSCMLKKACFTTKLSARFPIKADTKHARDVQ